MNYAVLVFIDEYVPTWTSFGPKRTSYRKDYYSNFDICYMVGYQKQIAWRRNKVQELIITGHTYARGIIADRASLFQI